MSPPNDCFGEKKNIDKNSLFKKKSITTVIFENKRIFNLCAPL